MPKQLSEDCHFIVAGKHFTVVGELVVQGQLVIWLPIQLDLQFICTCILIVCQCNHLLTHIVPKKELFLTYCK